MTKEQRERKRKILLTIEIGGDLATAVAKFVIGVIGNSSAIVAEGFHSLADTTNQIFLYIGIESSKKPADELHPFGYGKTRFFWALLSALFITIVSGGFAVHQGVLTVLDPGEVGHFGLAFLVLAVASVFQIINLVYSSRHYKKLAGRGKGLRHLFASVGRIKETTAINLWFGDMAAVGGNILAALALVLTWYTGSAVYDGVASILIGLGMIGLGIFLTNDAKELLVGEAVSPAMYEEISDIINSFDEVRTLVELKTMHLTPDEILINGDIDFQNNLSTKEIVQVIDRIERAIRREIPSAVHIFLEVER